jgi:hypothetical protein
MGSYRKVDSYSGKLRLIERLAWDNPIRYGIGNRWRIYGRYQLKVRTTSAELDAHSGKYEAI